MRKFSYYSLLVLIIFIFHSGLSALHQSKAPVIKSVTIGNQVWSAENFSLPVGNNFWYDRDSVKYRTHGRLYYFSAAVAAAPKGWHLPSDAEWQQLIDFVGPDSISRLMKGGDTGLNLTLSGYRSANSSNDLFGKMNEQGFYWTSTVKGEQTAYGRCFTETGMAEPVYYRRANAFSVRFIKD